MYVLSELFAGALTLAQATGTDPEAAQQAAEAVAVTGSLISAVGTIDEVIAAVDAVMVARGDLGVEIPMERIPHVQKKIIDTSIQYARPVIVATQMMEVADILAGDHVEVASENDVFSTLVAQISDAARSDY